MVEILELSDFGFKIPIINMVRTLLEKVNIQDRMCNMGEKTLRMKRKCFSFILRMKKKKKPTLQLK